MKLLYKFLLLPFYKKTLLINAVVLLSLSKILLLVSFKLAKKLTSNYPPKMTFKKRSNSINDITWSINTISNVIPLFQNCLIKSIATQLLLRLNGHNSSLRIGVDKNKKSILEAHAWVEAHTWVKDQEQIIIGGEISYQYKPLT